MAHDASARGFREVARNASFVSATQLTFTLPPCGSACDAAAADGAAPDARSVHVAVGLLPAHAAPSPLWTALEVLATFVLPIVLMVLITYVSGKKGMPSKAEKDCGAGPCKMLHTVETAPWW